MTVTTSTRTALLGVVLMAAFGYLVRACMGPKIDRSGVEFSPVERPLVAKLSQPQPALPLLSDAKPSRLPPLPLMKDGRAMFKVVMVGSAGVCDAMNHALAKLPLDARETWQRTSDSGWTFCSFTFVAEEKRWDGHAFHLHVFGHEGLGFLGQPGSSKDVVFKNAHAVFALTKGRDDTSHSAAVLDADLTRLHSQGTWPLAEVVMTPTGDESRALNRDLWKARTLDWPLDLATLFTALPDLFLKARR